MNKPLYIMMGTAFFLVLLFSSLSAEIVFSQWKLDRQNGTIQDHTIFQYIKGVIAVTGSLSEENPDNIFEIIYDFFFTPDEYQDYVMDYVKGDNVLEAYVLYDIYPQTWNVNNPLNKVDSCNFTIRISRKDQSDTTTVFNQTVTEDILKNKYFVRLSDSDVVYVDATCEFQNSSYNELFIPVNIQMVTPTWECKECQYYEWNKVVSDVYRAENFQTFTLETVGFIKDIIVRNIEIIFSLFWIVLILLLFAVLGIVFIGAYWLYLYLKRWIK